MRQYHFFEGVPIVLSDPRPEVLTVPKNALLSAADAVCQAQSSAEVEAAQRDLKSALIEILAMGDEKSLMLALNLAPSTTHYQYIWHTLIEVLLLQPNLLSTAVLFAIPLILVTGSREATQLAGELNDIQAVGDILRQFDVIRGEFHLWPKLLHPESLAGISFSELYRLGELMTELPEKEPFECLPAPIPAKEEGVYVRYLLGVALQNKNKPPIFHRVKTGEWSMALMRTVNQQLAKNGVTLFTIPLLPQPLPEALRQGAAYRLEINMQVFASGMIRKLREHQLPIVAIASAHENGELRFTISTPGEAKHMAAYVWPLAPLDSVPNIAENFRALMQECRVTDIRFIPAIQPDKQADGTPFFISSIDPEAESASLQ